MSYEPNAATTALLNRALGYVNEVPYKVGARWVFYRLLQDGSLQTKADYKRLLGYLSKARKEMALGWTPSTLSDDSREALINGAGHSSGARWLEAVARMECGLDRWETQDNYVEFWFEAAAMTAQFEFHSNENISLLAFHGDISIPEKWECAVRLARRWLHKPGPITIMYYGDLDEKGLLIPETARRDIIRMVGQAMQTEFRRPFDEVDGPAGLFNMFQNDFTFTRVGINQEHIDEYQIPENPERPGTYQWEALPDDAAQELIDLGNDQVDLGAFDLVKEREDGYTQQFRDHLETLEFEEDNDE